MSLYTVSLSVNDAELIKKPTHIIMWQGDSEPAMSNLTARIDALEKMVSKLCVSHETPLISGIDMARHVDSVGSLSAILPAVDTASLIKELISAPLNLAGPSEVKTVTIIPRMGQDSTGNMPDNSVPTSAPSVTEDESSVADADAEASDASDASEAAEAADAEADDEEEEEEEALQLEEIEYKGVTYYRDSENKIYQLDADGDLDETPVGIWHEEKQKVLKYAKA